LIQGETISHQIYIPRGDNRYHISLTASIPASQIVTPSFNAYTEATLTNRLEEFDYDPLTPEELTDLEISHREIREGKGIVKPEGMSVREFLDSL
jgi:hypothetical protein